MLVFPHGTTTIKRVLKNMQKNPLKLALKAKKKYYLHCYGTTGMLLYFSENWIFLSANMVSYDCLFKR